MEEKIIGKIVNTFQLKGKLKVTLQTDNPDDRFKVNSKIYIKDDNGNKNEYIITSYRQINPKVVVISLKGYDDINDVEQFVNKEISKEVSLKKGSYFYDDLLKMTVISSLNKEVGKVSNVIKMKNTEYLIVNNLYIPFQLDRFISKVDEKENKIYLTPLGDEVLK